MPSTGLWPEQFVEVCMRLYYKQTKHRNNGRLWLLPKMRFSPEHHFVVVLLALLSREIRNRLTRLPCQQESASSRRDHLGRFEAGNRALWRRRVSAVRHTLLCQTVTSQGFCLNKNTGEAATDGHYCSIKKALWIRN